MSKAVYSAEGEGRFHAKSLVGDRLMRAAQEFTAVPHEFDGQRVLATGGAKGICQAVTARLRAAGAGVLTTALKRPGDLADANLFVATDITPAKGCAALVRAVRERLGGVDIIVHVVGGSSAPAGGFTVLDDGEGQSGLALNLVAHHLVA